MEGIVDIIKSTREKLSDLSDEIQCLKSNRSPYGETIPSSFQEDNTSSADSSFTDLDDGSSPVVSLSASRKSSRLSASSSNGLTPLEKKEATVLAKVAELQKRGIWNRIPDKLAPPREKTHWDFVLEEMGWIYEAYRRDSQNSKKNAKKCKTMIQKYFADKEMAKLRAERAQEQNLRKIASFVAKEVKTFWGNIEKLFEFRLRSQLDKKRRQALDEHLNFLVDKSEKFTSMIAESLTETNSVKTTPAPSDSEMGTAGQDDNDYEPDQSSDDDERTIAKYDNHEADEIDKLKEESDIPVEDLLKQYYPQLYSSDPNTLEPMSDQPGAPFSVNGDNLSSTDDSDDDSESDDDEDDDDNDDDDGDDENNEEENGEDTENDDEPATKKPRTDEGDVDALEKEDQKDVETIDDEDENEVGLKALMTGGEGKFSDVIEMAAKFQPTGNTLDTTSVKTKVPFLLRGTLREYQHIGLDWMVSLYERKLNGILADEMGLGKTIQTISLLCHLACEKHIWGPHLIVVPTSVMLNWEMELKKWAPGFKVLTYYGSQKERRLKRVGWTKPNTFHVCITSYKLVIQDHQCFRRKRWQYLILDEAQHIKNFKSQRWQLLLNFASEGRLLLTGTPLQNNLMELWSLMHFLMPNIFESHRDFQEWFSNPLTGMVEGSAEYNEGLIQRLHKVLRPFLLRRLKNEVEKQLPKKFEHIIKCPLSKRQRYLYDDFMCRAKTKETLESGNLLSVINVLMQLRKVCNHPNLFEPRPTVVPFVADSVDFNFPRLVTRALHHDHLEMIDFDQHPLVFTNQEFFKTAYVTYRLEKKKVSSAVIHNGIVNNLWTRKINVPRKVIRMSRVVETNQIKKAKLRLPFDTVCKARLFDKRKVPVTVRIDDLVFTLVPRKLNSSIETEETSESPGSPKKKANDIFTSNDISKDKNDVKKPEVKRKVERQLQQGIFSCSIFTKPTGQASPRKPLLNRSRVPLVADSDVTDKIHENKVAKAQVIFSSNYRKCSCIPLYGQDFVNSCTIVNHQKISKLQEFSIQKTYQTNSKTLYSMSSLVTSLDQLVDRVDEFTRKFHMFVKPCVVVRNVTFHAPLNENIEAVASNEMTAWTHRLSSQHLLQLPETRLIQYDCGKLQVLGRLLHRLKAEGHRILIFTQMAKVLDILESFMNFQGHTYLRLDGSTKVEMRQILTERFNMNNKYFCFILSTRSGGVGINLTGADTVIFYDSDWNPTMDAQAQDRCHRIGQTRDVHIYRLVSERTIEENILKKANQKRLLGDLAIEGGNFTTAHFQKSTIKDLFEVNESAAETSQTETVHQIEENANQEPQWADDKTKKKKKIFESALTAAEENTDVEALKLANQEAAADEAEFNDEEGDNFVNLLKQLTPIEKFALAQMEFHEGDWKRDQLALADAALEAQRKELDARKQEELTLADRSSIATSASSRDQSSEEEDDTSEDEDEESTDETEEDESEEEEESESEEEIMPAASLRRRSRTNK